MNSTNTNKRGILLYFKSCKLAQLLIAQNNHLKIPSLLHRKLGPRQQWNKMKPCSKYNYQEKEGGWFRLGKKPLFDSTGNWSRGPEQNISGCSRREMIPANAVWEPLGPRALTEEAPLLWNAYSPNKSVAGVRKEADDRGGWGKFLQW